MQRSGEVTQLLLDHQAGQPQAFDQLVAIVYDDLKRIAHRQLQRAPAGVSLDTTGLVHEVYLKLVNQSRVSAKSRKHFFAIAARAMRHIIIVRARTVWLSRCVRFATSAAGLHLGEKRSSYSSFL